MSVSTLEQFVENISNFESINKENKILVLGYYLQKIKLFSNFDHNTIEKCFVDIDLSIPKNINSRLRQLEKQNQIVKNNVGYRLERSTLKLLEVDILGKPKLKEISKDLENLPKSLKEPEKSYVAETIRCLSVDAYRAAIVLMWTIIISHLRNYVIISKLTEFNIVLAQNIKFSKKKLSISKYDDFEDLGDNDFLNLLKNSKIISKNQHKLLNEKLGIRNMYAHPTNLTLTDTKTISLIEDLINDIIMIIK